MFSEFVVDITRGHWHIMRAGMNNNFTPYKHIYKNNNCQHVVLCVLNMPLFLITICMNRIILFMEMKKMWWIAIFLAKTHGNFGKQCEMVLLTAHNENENHEALQSNQHTHIRTTYTHTLDIHVTYLWIGFVCRILLTEIYWFLAFMTLPHFFHTWLYRWCCT